MPGSPDRLFSRLGIELGYQDAGGLVSATQPDLEGLRAVAIDRVRRHLPQVNAVYFAENVPLAYFATGEPCDDEALAKIHQLAWNDAQVPLLFVVDPSHVRVYDVWAEPARRARDIDQAPRLIRKLSATVDFLAALPELHRFNLDTGAYTSQLPDHFKTGGRCDTTLLENLKTVQSRLVGQGVPDHIAHVLLLRSILLLHLQHRRVLTPDLYATFARGATSLTDLYRDHAASYRFFEKLAARFNGDLLPVARKERAAVRAPHLAQLGRFLSGDEELSSGQMLLWPLYDFRVIPIQLISLIYEGLLHSSDGPGADDAGAYYTRHALVELVLNEVLPWPNSASTDTPLPRIIDPACGSGAFLVGAFRRLVAHWRAQHNDASPRARTLNRLLVEHLFGVDKNPFAVRVASFSLCLAMLDALGEADIWDELRFPHLTTGSNGDRRNLVAGDAFDQPTLADATFDLTIGNPPWRRDKLPRTLERWCRHHKVPVAGEQAHAFMWLAGELSPRGRVALLTPSKWLFNWEGPDVKFRREFFRRHEVDVVINLSAFRMGPQQLFARATGPTTAVVFRSQRSTPCTPSILYCTPRPGGVATTPTALLIDAADVKWLPREEAEAEDDLWKVLYTGSWRDLRLLRRLSSSGASIKDIIEKRGWKAGKGFQPGGEKSATRLTKIPFLDARMVDRYVVERRPPRPWPKDGFKWTGPLEIYETPHIVYKEGQKDGRFCAAFIPFSCSFRNTVIGVHAPAEDLSRLKALTAYLNSSLATYQLFLTASTWGIERPRVNKNEVLELPAAVLEDERLVNMLAGLLDSYASSATVEQRRAIEADIDSLVFEAFKLTKHERVLVSDMVDVTINYVQRADTSSAVQPPTRRDLQAYAESFNSVLQQLTGPEAGRISATIYPGRGPLCVASFQLNAPDTGIQVAEDTHLDTVLRHLDRMLWQREGANLFRRRHVRLFEGHSIHLTKPAERRFWTQSAALQDADEVLGQVLAGLTRDAR